MEEQLFILNFATRFLGMVSDQRLLIEAALDSFADFSQARKGAFFSLNEGKLLLKGIFKDGRGQCCETQEVESKILLQVVAEKRIKIFSYQDTAFALPQYPEADNKNSGGKKCICIPAVAKSGDVPCVLTFCDFFSAFDDLQFLHILATVLGISMENSRLLDLAIIDGLTGLYVRRYFDLRLSEELAKIKRGTQKKLCLLLIDLDCFKQINDRFGHDEGDKVLCRAGKIFMKNIRKGVDIACRYGGDEFTLIMPEQSQEQGFYIAKRLQKIFEQDDFLGKKHKLTLSIGIAEANKEHILSPIEMFNMADKMLYLSKQSGKNCIS